MQDSTPVYMNPMVQFESGPAVRPNAMADVIQLQAYCSSRIQRVGYGRAHCVVSLGLKAHFTKAYDLGK